MRVTPAKKRLRFNVGDLLAFSGHRWASMGISLASYAWPRWGASHLAIIGRHLGQTVLWESTTLADLPCLATGEIVRGVQVHGIEERISSYDGKVWHYPLTRVLTHVERLAVLQCLWKHLGAPYDTIGAVRSGGELFSWIESRMRPEDLSQIFCSELCADAHRAGGILETDNVSRWNPAKLVRYERKHNIIQRRGVRLK